MIKRNPKNTMWEMPKPLLRDAILHFFGEFHEYQWLDICATKKNRKFLAYFSKKINALKQKLTKEFFYYCNPPFNDLATWVEFCHDQHLKRNCTVLMIVPCYTDSSWWTEHIGNQFQYVSDFKFLDDRLGFLINNKPVVNEKGKRQVYYMPCVWILWRSKN